MPSRATVYVVDDNQAVRDALRQLLESSHLRTQTFATPEQCLQYLTPEHAGCLLLALRLPQMSGLDLYEQLQRRGIHLPTIVVTGYGNVPLAVKALKAGAMDFLEKPFDAPTLLQRVTEALDHDGQQRRRRRYVQNVRRRFDRLTARERQVLLHVLEGRVNRRIAKDLGLSQKTIEVHRARVMSKTEAHSLAELVRLALAAGIITGHIDDR